MKLLKSSVFQFCFMVLFIAGIAAYNDKITWELWLTQAVYFVGIFAGKEGVKYSASAYEGARK